MHFFLLSSALLIAITHCGYPVPEAYPTPPTYPTAPPSYPTPSYAQPKKYPVAAAYPKPSYAAPPAYPQKPSYSAPPPPPPNPSSYSSSYSESEVAAAPGIQASYSPAATTYSGNVIDYNSQATATFRKRAKARTVQNRQFHRRALQPIRRFQKKAMQ